MIRAALMGSEGRPLRERVGTFVWNMRWQLGYKLGGFTSARRSRR